jgi:hypothetical protein
LKVSATTFAPRILWRRHVSENRDERVVTLPNLSSASIEVFAGCNSVDSPGNTSLTSEPVNRRKRRGICQSQRSGTQGRADKETSKSGGKGGG